MSEYDTPEEKCWCGRPWWSTHRHFGIAPVEFGKRANPSLSFGEWTMVVGALVWLGTAIFLAAT